MSLKRVLFNAILLSLDKKKKKNIKLINLNTPNCIIQHLRFIPLHFYNNKHIKCHINNYYVF